MLTTTTPPPQTKKSHIKLEEVISNIIYSCPLPQTHGDPRAPQTHLPINIMGRGII